MERPDYYSHEEHGLRNKGIMLVLVVAIAIGVPKAGIMEGWLFPVNVDVQLTRVEPSMTITGAGTPQEFTIVAGHYTKLRDCDFVRSQWFKGPGLAVEINRLVEVQETPPNNAIPFGPLLVEMSPETLLTSGYIQSIHRCHPLWNTITTVWKASPAH